MRLSDTMLGGLLLVLGIALALYSQTFPDVPGQQYGAAVFPTIVAFGFMGCGVIMFVRGLRTSGVPLVMRTEWTRKPGAMIAVLVTILCVIAYIFLARTIGFIPLMTGILLLLFSILRVPLWQTLVFAPAATLLIDFVFRSMLLVPLPFGIMPRLPW